MNNILEHKEEFSLEGIKKTNSNEDNTKNETQQTNTSKQENNNNTYLPNQQMFYMYNPYFYPQMGTPMDSKGQPNQGMYYYYPVFIDPSKMPKDMNGQNMGMFYPPMMAPMYSQDYYEQNFKQNTNDK